VNSGLGLLGGGTTGDVTLHVQFGGDGLLNATARADHEHAAGSTNVAIGPGALPTGAGTSNTAVGDAALSAQTSGFGNTALGAGALRQSTTSIQNTALGSAALSATTSGSDNTAVGEEALSLNTTGSDNTAVGENALELNVTGSMNTALGTGADVGASDLTNATAIGALARVDRDNALVLGAVQGVNGAVLGTDVAIGTTSPIQARLHVLSTSTDAVARLERISASDSGSTITSLRARGTLAARAAVLDGDNLLSLVARGHTGALFNGGAFLFAEASENFTPTAGGARWRFLTTANGTQTTAERFRIEHDGRIGVGTTDPQALLHVAGTLRVDSLGTAGATTLCRNASNQIATCSSSLRYKDEVEPFSEGLSLLGRLSPISFTWKDGGARDVGFGAEDVAAVDPRLAVFDDAGRVEGVKYDRLTTVLVNAVKEQQALIERQQEALRQLTERVQALEAERNQAPRR